MPSSSSMRYGLNKDPGVRDWGLAVVYQRRTTYHLIILVCEQCKPHFYQFLPLIIDYFSCHLDINEVLK